MQIKKTPKITDKSEGALINAKAWLEPHIKNSKVIGMIIKGLNLSI